MLRRKRPPAARLTLVAALVSIFALSFAGSAAAYVTTDLTDFNLTETQVYYGGGTTFHISSGTDGWVSYRWLDSPSKQTLIGANSCSDGSNYGFQTINAGSTSYYSLFQGSFNQCFLVRGRTTTGQGSMNLYDGRIQR